MGTHPIFESDFDCLTVFRPINNMSSFKRLIQVAQKTAKASFNAARSSIKVTMEQNRIRAESAEQQREEEQAAKGKKSFLSQLTETKQMSVTEAIQVLGLEDKELTAELVNERFETMIEINKSGKHPSEYLIAKINNAHAATMEQFKEDNQKPEETVENIIKDEKNESKKKDEKG